MPSSTVTSKGQVTIPKAIRVALGVEPGDRVVFFQTEDGRVVVEPETEDLRKLRGLFHSEQPRLSIEAMDEEMGKAIARLDSDARA